MKSHLELFLVSIFYAFLVKFSCCEESSPIEYGVLAAETSTDKENFCIIYFQDFASLPETKSEAEFHILQNDSYEDWCSDHPESDVKSKVLLLNKGNCSVVTQAQNVHDRGGQGILFITESGRVKEVHINSTAAKDINMTVGLISENSVERLKNMYGNSSISVRLFAPYNMNFDCSLLVIWVIGIFTVAVGSYWSGLIRFAIYCKEINALPGAKRELPNKPSVTVNTAEESSMNISPYAVAGFVACMGVMLMLLYFFFKYLIYFIIGLFVLASILAIHSCLEPFVLKIKLGFCKTVFRCGARSCNIDFRQVFLACFAIAIPIYWVCIRNQRYAWILQDTLGVAFCIHMLKSIRLPSFKICTVLLVLLFFYDIFFVFVTPYLTKGESVMEEVATGGQSKEMVPMVLRVPHFGIDPLAICYQQFSLLGFGDLLVPGLLVSYCHGFDLVTNKKKIYFLVTVISFAIGLLITFVGLFLMNTAQPALLYLVPCTLIPPAIIGWCRGEFSLLWNGFRERHEIVTWSSLTQGFTQQALKEFLDIFTWKPARRCCCEHIQPTNVSADPEVLTEKDVPSDEPNNPASLPTTSKSVNQADGTNERNNEKKCLLR
nr:signal peptide peptidase-like 2A isoform X1 [Parasteatoda tepidariorum]